MRMPRPFWSRSWLLRHSRKSRLPLLPPTTASSRSRATTTTGWARTGSGSTRSSTGSPGCRRPRQTPTRAPQAAAAAAHTGSGLPRQAPVRRASRSTLPPCTAQWSPPQCVSARPPVPLAAPADRCRRWVAAGEAQRGRLGCLHSATCRRSSPSTGGLPRPREPRRSWRRHLRQLATSMSLGWCRRRPRLVAICWRRPALGRGGQTGASRQDYPLRTF
mmetsp:Transcript_19787/g.54984  ORF Transcript_19787/g.54984 Transcript_19787/m.54984 type:complete len:218 (-) Transcript_19787:226-879(-)